MGPIRTTLAVVSIAWAKSAFVLSLVRVTNGWIRSMMWAIFITVNMLAVPMLVLAWLDCDVVGAHVQINEGSCVPLRTILNFGTFYGGKERPKTRRCASDLAVLALC